MAKIRWFKAPSDSEWIDEKSPFMSNVWNFEYGVDYPQPSAGELDLSRTWDKGVAPPGATGQALDSPKDWFLNGPPAEAFQELPIGGCGETKAPQLASAAVGATFSIEVETPTQCAGLGVGAHFEFSLPGYAFTEGTVGVGAQFYALIDGGFPEVAGVGVGAQFSIGVAIPFDAGVGVDATFHPLGGGSVTFQSPAEVGATFDGIIFDPSSAAGVGVGATFEGYDPSEVAFTAGVGVGATFPDLAPDEVAFTAGSEIGATFEAVQESNEAGAGVGALFDHFTT